MITFLLLLGVIFSPLPVQAMDYSIEHMEIHVYLHEDGNVSVTEDQIYSFDGKFNGITRTLIPKENAKITDVKATENGKSLKIKQDDNEYKIYRSGRDEKITVTLTYTIKNGMERYTDVAQFYWPFFDERNESDYENLDIYVHPPYQTKDVIAFGYDAAMDAENVESGGLVHFAMGKVPAETKGDVRVAYDPQLFPNMKLTEEKPMRGKILAEKKEQEDKQAAFEHRKNVLNNLAPYVIASFSLYFLALLVYAWRRKRITRMEVERKFPAPYFIPDNEMSLPATISYLGSGNGVELLSASLLDLVRKRYIKQVDDRTFTVRNRRTEYEHEALLIRWLFDEMGANGTFHLDDIVKYTEDEANQEKYSESYVDWKLAVQDEVDEHGLLEDNIKTRVLVGVSAGLLVPFLILFAMHDLFLWMTFVIVLGISIASFALMYRPRTLQGAKIHKEWSLFMEKFPTMKVEQWNEQMDDNQKRAYIFAVGMNDKQMKEKTERMFHEGIVGEFLVSRELLLYTSVPSNANHYFYHANSTVIDSSTGGTTGSGTGGGGGGSGAF